MKKFLFFVLIWAIIVSALLIRNILFVDRKNKVEKPKQDEIVIQEKQETKKETDISEVEGAYKMLDFDRRLILKVGPQDESLCSIFCLAYARGILDNDYSCDPYDYYDGDGAVWYWAEFEDIAYSDPLLKVLQKAYKEIDNGRPTVFYVSGEYATTTGKEKPDRISGQHFVLIIGYRTGADYNNLKPSDFYIADPTGGYCYQEGCIPWATLTDNSPELMQGEYALFTDSNQKRHVDTCIAKADTAIWNTDLSKPIYPDYIKDDVAVDSSDKD